MINEARMHLLGLNKNEILSVMADVLADKGYDGKVKLIPQGTITGRYLDPVPAFPTQE